jgi:hypothetical protein
MLYEDVTKSFWTGRLEAEFQMVQLSATRCSFIAILWVSLVSFAAITLCVASQRVLIVVSLYFVVDLVRKLLDNPRRPPDSTTEIRKEVWKMKHAYKKTDWRYFMHCVHKMSIINIGLHYMVFFRKKFSCYCMACCVVILRGEWNVLLLSHFSLCLFKSSNFSFYLWILYRFGRTPWAGNQSRAKASTYTGQHNTEKHRHTSMPRAGFEPAIPMFEGPKTVLSLDRAAIETGDLPNQHFNYGRLLYKRHSKALKNAV